MPSRPSLYQVGKDASPAQALQARQELLRSQSQSDADFSQLFQTRLDVETISRRNCENLIGSIEIPVGVAGPLALKSESLNEEIFVPLATTEGALVASVSRGCKALTAAGGASVMVEKMGMTRSPVFECPTGAEARRFRDWFQSNLDKVQAIAESTSSHLKLLSVHTWIRGRYVFIRFAFDTEEAMGMNMVTIALQEALNQYLEKNNHSGIRLVSLSSNVCTDKKDSTLNALLGRGYWAQAEVFLSPEIVRDVLKTEIQTLLTAHTQKNLIGSNIAGSFSQNAHVANVLAALYLATGQDPAHVVDGSRAFLSLEEVEGQLYAALTLPSINVGVVGGGTTLGPQAAARRVIRGGGGLNAVQLATVTAAAALAGELSLMAALAEHKLGYAHQKLGRGKKEKGKQ